MVRYADDFVVLVEGTREQAEAEKSALAEFLRTELRMELSVEKTRITEVKEGFDFLGYRVVQAKALELADRCAARLRRHGLVARTVSVKVRASDVRFTQRLYVDSALKSPLAPLLANVDSVSVRDSLTPVLWLKHHENIRRLLAGTENRIGKTA